MSRPSPDEERRRVLRRMEWVYVYLPPILTFLVAGLGSVVAALVVPVPQTNFWGRWALAMVVILGIPALVYYLRSRFRGED